MGDHQLHLIERQGFTGDQLGPHPVIVLADDRYALDLQGERIQHRAH